MAQQEVLEAFGYELASLYDSEFLFQEALGQMIEVADAPGLKNVLAEMRSLAREQIHRLVLVFEQIKQEPHRHRSAAALGLVEDVRSAVNDARSEAIRDFYLASTIVKLSEYQMALYQTLMTIAAFVDMAHASDLLQGSLQQKDANLDTGHRLVAETMRVAMRPERRTVHH